MATLNLSSNGPSITKSYQTVVNSPPPSGPAANSPTYGQWAVFSVAAPLVSAFQQDSGKESVLKVQSTGEGELADLIDEFSDGRIQFAFVKVKDPNTALPKCVLIAWCGEGVPERTKGYFGSHLAAVSRALHGYHVQVTARSDRDLTPDGIVQKVADASGSRYSGGGAPIRGNGSGPPPPAASKPAFLPTRVGGGGAGFSPLGSRSRGGASKDENVDEDGWGADAPQVTRTQLEKVQSAYKPTKVNISELTSQKQEPSRFTSSQLRTNDGSSDTVKGAYQPIGKVDIAEIRRQAKEAGTMQDDRPTVVKGSYEPVGKVDIAAIRARAKDSSGGTASPPISLSPAATAASSRGDNRDEAPESFAERSTAFTQSERLTSMPKPKVSNKFGSSSAFTGTKAPAPSGFQSKPLDSAAPVGVASRTFADEGGKTPAQIWAEKKARERGLSGPDGTTSSGGSGGPASPLTSQVSGSGGWKSGYSGKSWAPVQTTRTGQSAASNVSEHRTGQDEPQEETATPPAGGVGAIQGRFKDAPPMGAAATTRPALESEGEAAYNPPPVDMISKPNAGTRGVPLPGLPARPTQATEEPEAEEHVRLPTPPAQPRSPTPPTPPAMRSGSPIRVAMPVGRGKDPVIDPPEERFSPPPMPTQSIAEAASAAKDFPEEEQMGREEPARAAAVAVAATTFGTAAASAANPGASKSGKRALIQYDYEKAEDNEIELKEGEYVTNIEMVDEDWWMGQNSQGDIGLFPSNYVELVEDEEEEARTVPAPAPVSPPAAPSAAPRTSKGTTATAQYDYEAAEENELSFPDGANITGIEFPDEDWWFGEYNGKTGLFPANYVQLDE